jgi:hypothetical protein
MLDHSIRVTVSSPLLYHLNFMVRLAEGTVQLGTKVEVLGSIPLSHAFFVVRNSIITSKKSIQCGFAEYAYDPSVQSRLARNKKNVGFRDKSFPRPSISPEFYSRTDRYETF